MGLRKMNQTGDSSNFVQIGDAGSGNVYHVAQNTAAGPSYVQLEIDPDSVHRYPKAEVQDQALVGGILAAIPFVTTFVAYFADWLGILSYLELPKFFVIVVGFSAGMALTFLGALIMPRSSTFLHYWISSKSAKRGEAKLVGLNKFVEVDESGNYLTYCYTAPCIYPRCDGKVVVEKLPPREQHRDGLAGVCSVAGEAHSFLIDYNIVARPRELDWRPMAPPNPSPGYRR
jgi:hypothetical protein